VEHGHALRLALGCAGRGGRGGRADGTPRRDRRELDVAVLGRYGPGKLAEELLERLVVPTLRAPTFVRDFPEATAPLARAPSYGSRRGGEVRPRTSARSNRRWDTPNWSTRWFGATGSSPRHGRPPRGDIEAGRGDEDFLRAVEYGMPPSGEWEWASTGW
jgi:lysyl-tRNA synthetase, class II